MSLKKVRSLTKQIPSYIKAGHIVQAMQLEKIIACTFELSPTVMALIRGLPQSYIEKLQGLYGDIAYKVFETGAFQRSSEPIPMFLEDMVEAINLEMGAILDSFKRDRLFAAIKNDLETIYNDGAIEGSQGDVKVEEKTVTAQSQQTLDKFEEYVKKLPSPEAQKILRYYLGVPLKIQEDKVAQQNVPVEEPNEPSTNEPSTNEPTEVLSDFVGEICGYNVLDLKSKILGLLKGIDLSIEDNQFIVIECLIKNVVGYKSECIKDILEQKLGVLLTDNYEDDLLNECVKLTNAVGLNGSIVITEIDNNMCLAFVFNKADYQELSTQQPEVVIASKKEKTDESAITNLPQWDANLAELRKDLKASLQYVLQFSNTLPTEKPDQLVISAIKSIKKDIKISEGLIHELINKFYSIYGNGKILTSPDKPQWRKIVNP